MSSTNRGATRRERDLYMTPKSAFDLMLPYLPRDKVIWEPACGDGRIVNWIKEAGGDAVGNDLAYGYDFLTDTRNHDFILTNPPFSLAAEFVDHALKLAPEVMMLLPLNFAGSQKRHRWFRRIGVNAKFNLSERPCFTEDGKTDSNDYAWWYWGSRYSGDHWPEPVIPLKRPKDAPEWLWPRDARDDV